MLLDVEDVDVACAREVGLACDGASERRVLGPGVDEDELARLDVRADAHRELRVALEQIRRRCHRRHTIRTELH